MIATDLLDEWYKIAGILIGLATAASIVWGVVKVVGHMQRVHEAIIGRPETKMSEGIPSIIERFHVVDEKLEAVTDHLSAQDLLIERVEAEFRTNGGSTVKDDLRGLQRQLNSVVGNQATAAKTAIAAAEGVARTAVDTAAELHRTGP